jgi:chromosomal replication initiator protein
MNNHDLWQAALGELELSLSRANFTTWFKSTFIAEYDNNKIIIGVPNAFTKVWLEKKYHDSILKTLHSLTNKSVVEIIYKVETTQQIKNNYFSNKPANEFTVTLEPSLEQNLSSVITKGGLNSKYRFDNFIVGKGNELAYAAFCAASKNPGKVYNPLLLYGGVGLGKTHLLQGFGNIVLKESPKARVLYVTTEKFTTDFISAVKGGHAKEFKDNYRNVDVLLIDDIQFIAGKEGTQEEFFHTFNALHQANKQIVITSDRPPKAIPTIEQRLLSRFIWGMTADIAQPDIETRMAILEAKCKEKSYDLNRSIVQLVASFVQQNVRELEGALNKIIAHHQFSNTAPTVESVKALISTMNAKPKTAPISAQRLIKVVAEYFSISLDDLMGKSRKKSLVIPRQIAMYLMRQEAGFSFPGIGQELGNRDHTTAIHACTKIEKEIDGNANLRQNVEAIKQRLYQPV